MARVELGEVRKKYGGTEVIHGIDLQVDEGEFCVFVGPSGCGKSTLLRMIAGLEETSAGRIRIGADDVTEAEPADRGIAMVFQSYALYPHMTVAENMGFGLRMAKVPRDEIDRKVREAAGILQLEEYLERKPKALSGGQRQRVAIGRAIVRGPKVFLFDEPLSNLDAELRVGMRVEIARLHKEIGATMIYVTHDQVEAMTLADRIVVLREGVVEQQGKPLDLYRDPDNRFVAGFIGSPAMNFFAATAAGGEVTVPGLGGARFRPAQAKPADGKLEVGLRPQQLRALADKEGALTLEISEHLGGVTYDYLSAPTGERVVVEAPGDEDLASGGKVRLEFEPQDALLFDAGSGARLR